MMMQEVFINNLKKAMRDKDLNARELSKRSGLSEGTISRYLSGKMEPRVPAIAKIAQALSIDPVWLLGLNDHDEPIVIEHDLAEGLNERSLYLLKVYADYLRTIQEDAE